MTQRYRWHQTESSALVLQDHGVLSVPSVGEVWPAPRQLGVPHGRWMGRLIGVKGYAFGFRTQREAKAWVLAQAQGES